MRKVLSKRIKLILDRYLEIYIFLSPNRKKEEMHRDINESTIQS